MRRFHVILSVLITVFLSGCINSVMDPLKGAPAEHSGFIENPEHMKSEEIYPLDSFWISDVLINDHEQSTANAR